MVTIWITTPLLIGTSFYAGKNDLPALNIITQLFFDIEIRIIVKAFGALMFPMKKCGRTEQTVIRHFLDKWDRLSEAEIEWDSFEVKNRVKNYDNT